ncbi:putative signal peptidase complex subunit 2 [Medicago truncatula]|uniref:Signal peptidase complex subunit 2 n=1 Tax=Medicago truncatula TaxID=3880 RepID=A0A396HUR2_MEDTR|nr:putative signal peptidase complex subunit 2 [Medicago truncatula]
MNLMIYVKRDMGLFVFVSLLILLLHCCLILDSRTYVVFNLVLQLIIYTKEKNAILFTYPLTFFMVLVALNHNLDVASFFNSDLKRVSHDMYQLVSRVMMQTVRCRLSFRHTSVCSNLAFISFLQGSFTSTGLVVSSKLPRFSDMYTLTIESADPKSVSANEPVHLTKSVTQWFTKDGVLVEGLFWKEVEALIAQYTKEPKKSK